MIRLDILRKLYPSIGEHREVEHRLHDMLGNLMPGRYLGPLKMLHRPTRYAQKNFFSTLFLAVYRAAGVPKDRRLLYGMLNHSIRGVVTGADNILDAEYKEMIPLVLPESGVTFKSVMHVLLFEMLIDSILDDAESKGIISSGIKEDVRKGILAALMPIGEREAEEESGAMEILPPDVLLSTVHMYRGGNLLRLAFVAPLIIEEGAFLEKLTMADRGIYSIGMALQVIDDLTDFYDDIRDHRRNYLVSAVEFEAPDEEKEKLHRILEGSGNGRAPIETAYKATVPVVMERAIGEALKGFDLLDRAGLGVDRRSAFNIINYLFHLRGVKNLLVHLPPLEGITHTLGEQSGT